MLPHSAQTDLIAKAKQGLTQPSGSREDEATATTGNAERRMLSQRYWSIHIPVRVVLRGEAYKAIL